MHTIRPLRIRMLAAIGRREFRNTTVVAQWPWQHFVDLRGLRGSRLCFRHSRFDRPDFTGAHLLDADFSNAAFTLGRFPDGDFSRASFTGSHLIDADFGFSKLTGTLFNNAQLHAAHIHGDASGAEFRYGVLHRASLSGANLAEADFRNAELHDAHFVDSDLVDAKFQEAVLTRADLTHATLVRADLRNAKLGRAHLAGADLEHADLRGTDLSTAYLEGARLSSTRADGSPAFDRHTKWPLFNQLIEGATMDGVPFATFMADLRLLARQRFSATERDAILAIAAARSAVSSDTFQR